MFLSGLKGLLFEWIHGQAFSASCSTPFKFLVHRTTNKHTILISTMASSSAASEASVAALLKTQQALQDIRDRMQPFLDKLKPSMEFPPGEDGNLARRRHAQHFLTTAPGGPPGAAPSPVLNAAECAVARAAVALSLGTIRVIGARLQGQDRGRRRDDPLRQELDKIRAALMAAQAQHGEVAARAKHESSLRAGKGESNDNETSHLPDPAGTSSSRRKRPSDEGAHEGGTAAEEKELFSAKKAKADIE